MTSVSADPLTDEASGEQYYPARSALDYLVEPLMKGFDRAFRES